MFFFTADLHFDHDFIIEACNRPFRNIEEMNAELIGRWNSKVSEKDTVYVLGDFKFTSKHSFREMTNKLNGEVVILRGNHDRNNGTKSLIDKVIITEFFGKKLLMVHDPNDAREVMFDLALVGHVHTAWKIKQSAGRLLVNVGVDVWDFYPINMKQILKVVKKWEKEVVYDLSRDEERERSEVGNT